MSNWKPGDRVIVSLPALGRLLDFTGTVRAVDNGSRPGVTVDLDRSVNGLSDCYATHSELQPLNVRPGSEVAQHRTPEG